MNPLDKEPGVQVEVGARWALSGLFACLAGLMLPFVFACVTWHCEGNF